MIHTPDAPQTQKTQNFTPPRHWVTPEELSPSYWQDEKLQEKRGQEFHDKPIETLELLEKIDSKGLHRRDFLTLMGASMALAGAACARRPVNKIIPYVVKPEQITPGVPVYYSSTYTDGGIPYGILIKTREARPIKIEGNPDHPMSGGKLHARAQASVLDLYDTDRVRGVIRPSSRGGVYTNQPDAVSFADADQAILEKLKSAGGKVRILTDVESSPTTRQVVLQFLKTFGASESAWVEYNPSFSEDIAQAAKVNYGFAAVPSYQFAKADVVVSLGADFLGTFGPTVKHSQDWAKNRKLNSKNHSHEKMSKFFCFESNMSITGANADERVPVKPGDELYVALALAHVVTQQGRFAGNAALQNGLKKFSPAAVESALGISGLAEIIERAGKELLKARGKGIVVAGGVATQSRHAFALQSAVNLINSALDNEGSTVVAADRLQGNVGFSFLSVLMDEMNQGKVDVLIISGVNPVFSLPPDSGFKAALSKVGTVIFVGQHIDETAESADWVMGSHHYLENWGDAYAGRGTYSLQQPAIAPLHKTRSFQDLLLAWSGIKTTWHDTLKAAWKEKLYPKFGAGKPFEEFWESALRKGVLVDASLANASPRSFGSDTSWIPESIEDMSQGIRLGIYESVMIGNGSAGNNGWLQGAPDPISTVTWDNYLNVGPTLAKNLGLVSNDVVDVNFGNKTLRVPVFVQPGLHPQTVTLAMGYGHSRIGAIGNNLGKNAAHLAEVHKNQLIFAGISVQIRKTGSRYELGMTQGHHLTKDRPIINDITLAQFQGNPAAESHTDPHLRMTPKTLWPKHEYKGYRWGMGIDLNSCTGCGACVVACQAENNIPIIGRDLVRMSREMHWIRIDRYYSGDMNKPDVVFQPMLCQHCENASCETVCPVLATVHSDEGLNDMSYNRCVGTRYCQNNCPYKVRRFNFFDHWKDYKGKEANMIWNPDVTVRSRGVMEKCTFCVQRIQASKDQARDQKRKIKDGELKTACQQTCPTEAIVFGDMNDPNTAVSQVKNDPRGYRVLEILNNVPSITYLSKVRNKVSLAGGHGAAAGNAGQEKGGAHHE